MPVCAPSRIALGLDDSASAHLCAERSTPFACVRPTTGAQLHPPNQEADQGRPEHLDACVSLGARKVLQLMRRGAPALIALRADRYPTSVPMAARYCSEKEYWIVTKFTNRYF
jgi:hypothetical protein